MQALAACAGSALALRVELDVDALHFNPLA